MTLTVVRSYVAGWGRLAGFGGGCTPSPPIGEMDTSATWRNQGDVTFRPPPSHGSNSMEGTGACSCQHH